MSDSDESGVTHTKISSLFEDLPDIGSPGVIGPEHEGLPWMLDDPYVQVALQAPPSPNYIPGPEEPQSPPLPDFSPDYVPESDPKADPEEDDNEDPEEDPVDYPADGGGDGDDEDESSEDDEDDDEVDIKANDDEEEEEEHPAPVDSTVVALPAADQALSSEETEPFKTDKFVATPPPHPAYCVTARISIPALVPTPVWSDVEVARLLAISTPPSSPLSPWSSPLPQIPSSPLPPIPSPSLPVSPPPPVSSLVFVLSLSPLASPVRPLGYQAAMIWLRAEAASTSHLLLLPPPIILSHTRPAAPSSGTPPLHLLSTDRREDRPEVTLPPRKRLGIALGPAYEVGESSSAAAARPTGGLRADYDFVATMDRDIRRDLERDVGYGITDSWDKIVETLQGAPVSTDTELGRHMTTFETRVRQDTDEIYTRLDDELSGRQLLAGRLNMLFRDRRAHARTARLIETEARISREAWGRSMDASDLARAEETDGDYRDAGGRSQEAEAAHRGTEANKETSDLDDRVRETAGTRQRKWHQKEPRGHICPEKTNTTICYNAQLQAMINQGVTAALAARDANTNGVDSHNSGTGARRNERTTCECTYPDFMKCQPLNFKGTEGVVKLTQWIEKMEIVFRISNCSLENQIKVLTFVLFWRMLLTWWNSHVRLLGNDIAYAMTWTELKKKITDKYYPRTEIKKLEVKLMFSEESDKIEKYVGGLPDMIHGSVVASKPKTMQEATEMAIEVMDKRIPTFVDRQTENKRKQDNNQQPQQQHQNKRQNTGRAYAAGTIEKKQYGGSKPQCSKCNYHHDGPCAPKCHKCNKVGHFAHDCRSTANVNNANNQRALGLVRSLLAMSMDEGVCGRPCRTDPDSNVVTGMFLLNNHYASILFDTGADRSFVSTAFSSQIHITPSILDHYYDVELADGRIIRLNTNFRGYTLNFLNHPFNIDLIPVELGSFDAIIGMDFLAKYQAIIVYVEKIVRIPWGNETLIVRGDRSNRGNRT
ncbi:putative reverse transcriptase domain-containing protein, partial [Tanacetum coccineum]